VRHGARVYASAARRFNSVNQLCRSTGCGPPRRTPSASASVVDVVEPRRDHHAEARIGTLSCPSHFTMRRRMDGNLHGLWDLHIREGSGVAGPHGPRCKLQ
jgi:hypothetical protein